MVGTKCKVSFGRRSPTILLFLGYVSEACGIDSTTADSTASDDSDIAAGPGFRTREFGLIDEELTTAVESVQAESARW